MTDTKNQKRISIRSVYQKGVHFHRPAGSDAWELLGDRILSEKAKEIVRNDPNLGPNTMRELIRTQNGELEEVPFHFGYNEDGEEDVNVGNIGLPLLSSCIKEDKNATWAEITGRYAAIRRIPFIETAIELRKMERQHGLYYYDDNSGSPIRWKPKPWDAGPLSVQDMWDLIMS